MPDWRTGPLGSFVEFQRGIDITRAVQTVGDIPVVSSGGVSSYHNEAYSPGPGVVIGRKGTLGKAFYLPGPYWPHDTTLWVRDFKGNHPKFIYYFMSRFDVSWLDAGSANPTLNRNHLHPVVVTLPSPPEQQAIAEVLGTLDDKIAANTALAGKALEYADKLFPPAGVEGPTRLGDVVTVTKGSSYNSADLAPSDHALVSLKSVTRDGRFTAEGLKQFTGKFRPQQVIAPDEVVVAQTDLTHAAEVVGRAIRVPRHPALTLVASLDIAIVRPTAKLNPTYLLGLLRQPNFREHCRSNTTGTTVLHLRSGAIEDFATEIADAAIQEGYARAAQPALRVADASLAENRTLAATRDALLPQLMSGKLRVRDAEGSASMTVGDVCDQLGRVS